MNCGSTHALMPEFSLPGTSIGSAEAAKYIQFRKEGVSQATASKVFIQKGMGPKYGIRFEQRLIRTNFRAIAIFPQTDDPLHDPMQNLLASKEPASTVFPQIQHRCLQRGYNPLFFSRCNILRIRENKMGKALALNKGAIWSGSRDIDSS